MEQFELEADEKPVKIVSDGTPCGTYVWVGDSKVPFTKDICWKVDFEGVECKMTIYDVHLEFTGEAKVNILRPGESITDGTKNWDKTIKDSTLEIAARSAHEANRALCISQGDLSQSSWEDAPEWQRISAINGVMGVVAGNGPEQSHESWLAERAATGWKYGPVKNPETKEHPCFVPYSELPPSQKVKDAIFVGVVKAILDALTH